jgi:ParB family transcriptional regulator, chromosome partitioning protein
MAKRKRLTPADPDSFTPPMVLETKAYLRPGITPPPIAQVAGDASTTAALAEVSEVLATARAEGRLVQRLALTSIDAGYLVRDRLAGNQDEMQALMDSLRSHGQRTPIEVTEIAPGRYGLISGWRRITALTRLFTQTGDARYETVLALLRRPDTASDAYVAMVEENEVRLGLSYYERARIVALAVEHGVFGSDKAALQALFATASRAKRSKIGSFLDIYRHLGVVLQFPIALPERLGLTLSHLLSDDPDAVAQMIAALQAQPAATAEDELAHLSLLAENAALKASIEPVLASVSASQAKDTPRPAPPDSLEIRPGVFLKVEGGWTKPILILSGPNVDPGFRERLEDWLKNP